MALLSLQQSCSSLSKMSQQSGTESVMDRLATAGIGIRDQVSTADFLSAMADRTFLVRAAISLVSEPIARVIVLDDLPSHNLIGRRVSHYGRVAFIETHIAGEVFTHWCDAGSGQVDGLTFVLPKVQEWATWERQPSHWTYGSGPIPWPVLRGEVNL